MSVFIHPTAEVSPDAIIGDGTKIWNNAQVREKSEIGTNCIISKNVYIDTCVKIGNNCKIQNNVNVYHGVFIENDVFLGPSMTFTNDLYPRADNQEWEIVQTIVRQGVSIGANATIICGVTLSDYAMIGAGAVVTKDVPQHALVVGNPARIIGYVCKCGQRYQIDEILCTKCGYSVDIMQNLARDNIDKF